MGYLISGRDNEAGIVRALKVKEVIVALQKCNPDARILVEIVDVANDGNHTYRRWVTEVWDGGKVVELDGDLEIDESRYSQPELFHGPHHADDLAPKLPEW